MSSNTLKHTADEVFNLIKQMPGDMGDTARMSQSMEEFQDRLKGPEDAYKKLKQHRLRERALTDALTKILRNRHTLKPEAIANIIDQAIDLLADEEQLNNLYKE